MSTGDLSALLLLRPGALCVRWGVGVGVKLVLGAPSSLI